VTAAVPPCPSLVAVIAAVPADTAVTNPLPLTVATPSALVDQVTARPASTLPFASFGVAVSWTAPPTNRVVEVGVTATDATEAGAAGTTVTAAESLLLALATAMM